MRLVVMLSLMCLAGCASDKLAQSPPAGVDFSGHWKLNEADSDDPQRLIQAQFNTTTNSQNTTTQGGSGGRGGRQGGRGGGGAYPGGPVGPSMPSITAMGDAVRWPGKQVEVKQVAGVVAFTSEGINRVCEPSDGSKRHRHHGGGGPDDRDGAGGRDAAPRARDVPPPHCGWEEKTLIVRGGDADDERPPFEEHYSLSDDGTRLIGEIEFKGGRSNGFVMSRVWDRLP
jgi:hypothetical protein